MSASPAAGKSLPQTSAQTHPGEVPFQTNIFVASHVLIAVFLVSQFPSKHFYHGKIQDGVKAIDRKRIEGFDWPGVACPVCFINIKGTEASRNGT